MKNKLLRLLQINRGSALPMVLVALVVFSVLGVTVSRYISAETKTAKQTQYYLQARYLAEAGVEKAIFETKRSLQNGGTTLSGYDFKSNGWPGGNTINPGNNFNAPWVPNSLIPAAPVSSSNLSSVISSPTDSRWIGGYLDATTSGATVTPLTPTNTYTWQYKTQDTGVVQNFNLKGHFIWTYDTDPDTSVHWREGGTTGVFSSPNTFTQAVPDQIFFNESFIGVGQIFLPDNTTYTRKIKVRANFNFSPARTPDAQVTVNIEQWYDM